MKTNYLKHIFYDMRHHPMVTWVNIIGTALAIFLLMTVVQMDSIKIESFRPESNRDRMLHTFYLGVQTKNGTNISPISYKTIQRLYADLPGTETVTSYTILNQIKGASLPSQKPISVNVREVDDNFFSVFDLKFIEGKPFDKSKIGTEDPTAVITESVARRLFGTTDVVGKQMLVDYSPVTISGIVEDVTSFASRAYSEVWLSLSRDSTWEYNHILGLLSATILAESPAKFDEIRQEINRRKLALQTELCEVEEIEILDFGQPFDQETSTAGSPWNNNIDDVRREKWILYAILLIVPAINIASMTNSRMRQRLSEMAVMRSYGCTRWGLMRSLIAENMIVTLCAGLIGLIASLIFARIAPEFLFLESNFTAYSNPTVDFSILFHWSTFFMALGFCFVLNLLSCGLPAWNASRQNIINSLHGNK